MKQWADAKEPGEEQMAEAGLIRKKGGGVRPAGNEEVVALAHSAISSGHVSMNTLLPWHLRVYK